MFFFAFNVFILCLCYYFIHVNISRNHDKHFFCLHINLAHALLNLYGTFKKNCLGNRNLKLVEGSKKKYSYY